LTTVDRVTGSDVTHHFGATRIAHEQEVVRKGQSVSDATLASGMHVEVDFNRAFHRVAGQNPTLRRTDRSVGTILVQRKRKAGPSF
jgi:methylphosphotriester-DNA--protein-cysteine methyltransferase